MTDTHFLSKSELKKSWLNFAPFKKGIFVGTFTIFMYLLVVVVTTPALEPVDSVRAALQLNSIVIFGMGLGIGLQIYLTEKSKRVGCKLKVRKRALGGNSGSSVATSFFSFFSLVPLGCCGWWLYALSLLPSVFGSGISAILIEYSQTLSYIGLTIIFAFSALTAIKLRQEKNQRSSYNDFSKF